MKPSLSRHSKHQGPVGSVSSVSLGHLNKSGALTRPTTRSTELRFDQVLEIQELPPSETCPPGALD